MRPLPIMWVLLAGALLAVAGLLYMQPPLRGDGRNPRNWEVLTESPLIHDERFSHLFFFDGSNGIAISSHSMKRSSDGGKSWSEVQASEGGRYYSLLFTDNQTGWVVGSIDEGKPLVLRSSDKGRTWQRVDFDEKSFSKLNGKFTTFLDICLDREGKAWIAGDGGVIQAVTAGQTWVIHDVLSTKETLYSVSCNGSGEVWAVGQHAVLLYQNGWVRKEVDKIYVFGKVISKGSDVWLLGGDQSQLTNGAFDAGVLLKSQNNGQTWENKTPGSADLLNDLYLKDRKGWLIGAEGSIYYSSDNGNTWTKMKSPTRSDLSDIFFLNSGEGWISGTKATVLKYTD